MGDCSDLVRCITSGKRSNVLCQKNLVWYCRLAFLTLKSMAPIQVEADTYNVADGSSSKAETGLLAKGVKELQSRMDQLTTRTTVVRETKGLIRSPGTVDQAWRFWPGATYLEALPNCQTLKCIREAHRQLPKRNISYNFPHFFIAGYSKSASTSIYQYAMTCITINIL